MLPNRFTVASSSSAARKSRLEGKPSLLPKPRRPGSVGRPSAEAHRPSGTRSSSAEPPRTGVAAAGRLSRDASATKLPFNRRSRSQQGEGDRRTYATGATTPLRSTNLHRPTTTPVRTPSEDRTARNWQTSLDRALAFVTIKDTRPIQNTAWQRAQSARVQEALAALASRGPETAGGGGASLVRPLTIARFVEMTGLLLGALTRDQRLSTDNYVARLPHMSKRLLYPGVVSKSWLRTVNTLHSFPQALALLAYFVDLFLRVEAPVSDDWLYVEKDELAQLRRDYLYKCFIRFQDPDPHFDDLNEEHLRQLKLTLGDDEERIAELQLRIEHCKARLNDEYEAAARADEARKVGVRNALLSAVRGERTARVNTRGLVDQERARGRAAHDALRAADADIERATAEGQQLRRELDAQTMSVAERTRLLEEVDYENRVIDSKRALAEQIAKMVVSKENELTLWQKKALDACLEYKQGLIHLSADRRYLDLAALAVDEKELMGAGCARVGAALDALKRKHAALGDELAELERSRRNCVRRRAARLEETRIALEESRAALVREKHAAEVESAREAAEAGKWALERRQLDERVDALQQARCDRPAALEQLAHWEAQDRAWRDKLSKLRLGVEACRAEAEARLPAAKEARTKLVLNAVQGWHAQLDGLPASD